ncbi:hypothetical protein ACWO25_004539 [Vibrio parahaemolyticus]
MPSFELISESLDEWLGSSPENKQEEKLGNGGLNFLIRLINAFFASPHPLGNPVGRQSQIAHSSSLAAWVGCTGNKKAALSAAVINNGFMVVILIG